MVTITNGKDTFVVTRGAFEGIFSDIGYNIVSNDNEGADKASRASEENVDTNVDVEKTEEEVYCEKLKEKPISSWSKEEIKKFAIINSIDITGTKNANEAKDIIKNYLD